MRFLTAIELRKSIQKTLAHCEDSVFVSSAFVTTDAFNWLNFHVKLKKKKCLLGRFRLADFLFKSSSFDVIRLALESDWSVGIDEKLHSKVFVVDDKSVYLGSSNLTANGLGLNSSPNNEANIFFETSSRPSDMLDALLKDVIWLDLDLVKIMKDHLVSFESQDADYIRKVFWPSTFFLKQKIITKQLIISDFPDIKPSDLGEKYSCFTDVIEIQDASDFFISSPSYHWVKELVRDARNENCYTNFGWLSYNIHIALKDTSSSRFSRAKAKTLCWFMFEWIEEFSTEFEIITYKRTKSLKLLQPWF